MELLKCLLKVYIQMTFFIVLLQCPLGHRNVYVAVHVPYSQSKHKHRHKKSHNGRSRHGNGHGRLSEGNIPLREEEEEGVEPDRVSEPGGRVHFDKKTHTKFHKSLSLPNSRPTHHQEVNVPSVLLGEWGKK